jgi:1-deoxy-D-xylulose-5-phosphate synthase
VAIQNLPVRFAIDRAGLVGADGATHAGSRSTSTYLATLPNMVADGSGRRGGTGPHGPHRGLARRAARSRSAIRAATASGVPLPTVPERLEIGKGRVVREGSEVAILRSARVWPKRSRRLTSSMPRACRRRWRTCASPSRSTRR